MSVVGLQPMSINSVAILTLRCVVRKTRKFTSALIATRLTLCYSKLVLSLPRLAGQSGVA